MTYNIERLYVIAGPRGVGKSTFIRNPSEHISASDLPDSLRSIVTNPSHSIMAKHMPRHKDQELGDVRLHVDLITPLDSLRPFKPEACDIIITDRIYSTWPALECIGSAKEVHFITLILSRQMLFRRWLDRTTQSNSKHCMKNVVTVYGDSSDDASALKALYKAWCDFTGHFTHHGHTALDVSEKKYRFHPKFNIGLITDK